VTVCEDSARLGRIEEMKEGLMKINEGRNVEEVGVQNRRQRQAPKYDLMCKYGGLQARQEKYGSVRIVRTKDSRALCLVR
jgi:hypothetical protein